MQSGENVSHATRSVANGFNNYFRCTSVYSAQLNVVDVLLL